MTIIRIQGFDVMVDDEDVPLIGNIEDWFYFNTARARHFQAFYFCRHIYSSEGKFTLQRLHRLLVNAPKGSVVDHIDGNPLNNQKSNLRICNQTINCLNAKMSRANTSGYTGVYWHSRDCKWQACLRVDGKQMSLGYYETIEEAVSARSKALLTYYPDARKREIYDNTKISINEERQQLVIPKRKHSSGIKGVSRCRDKWQAYYTAPKIPQKFLGYYNTIEDASNAVEQYKTTLNENLNG